MRKHPRPEGGPSVDSAHDHTFIGKSLGAQFGAHVVEDQFRLVLDRCPHHSVGRFVQRNHAGHEHKGAMQDHLRVRAYCRVDFAVEATVRDPPAQALSKIPAIRTPYCLSRFLRCFEDHPCNGLRIRLHRRVTGGHHGCGCVDFLGHGFLQLRLDHEVIVSDDKPRRFDLPRSDAHFFIEGPPPNHALLTEVRQCEEPPAEKTQWLACADAVRANPSNHN